MSNQLVITSGAKVRSLNGVITGTTGVLDSLPINAANGIPQLDSSGKILVSQLPNSVMEYKGTWNAATNTPTLADGTGNQGDVYLCNVAGTVNFGSGPIAFVVGDQVIYSGTIWQRASGATGTVTSVAVTESGDALSITGSPITTSGTINIGFAGTSAQYVAGDGSLITFPSLTDYVTLITNQTITGVKTFSSQQKFDGGVAIKEGISGTLTGYTVLGANVNQLLVGVVGATQTLTFPSTTSYTYTFPSATGTLALTSDLTGGTVTSVGLTMPSAFNVASSPITTSGTIAVTAAGYPSQYIRGDGTLADFPTSGGGGSSVSYYLNGGTSQGTIGGTTYYEMSRTAETGTGVDFSKSGDGLIVSFLTDANDPALLNIPGGNWNYEIYASMSSNGGTPELYAELYKYNGTTFTLISTSSNEILYDGTNLNLYTFAMAVPSTTLAITDRLAVKLYATNSGGKTTTVHTQNGHLCQIITTFSTGITALNGLTAQVQYFATGTSGTDFNISSATATHTFNLPTASATNRGALSSADWTTFNNKQNALTNPITGTGTSGQVTYFNGTSSITSSANLAWDGTNLSIGNPSSPLAQLHVYNASAAATILLQTNSTTDYSEIAVRNNSSTATSYFRQYSTATTGSDFGISRAGLALFFSNYATNFAIGTRNGGNLILGTNDTERVRILSSNGYVGINTSSPNSQLEIYGSTGGALTDGLRISRNTLQTSQYGVVNYTAGILNLTGVDTGGYGGGRLNSSNGTTTNEILRWTYSGSAGYVSIGNTNTSYNFDVTGTGRFTGAVLLSSSLTVNGVYFVPSTSYFRGNSTFGYRFNNAADTANLFILADSGAANFYNSVTATRGSFAPSFIAIGSSNGNGQIQLSNSSNYVIGAGTDYGGMSFTVGGSEKFNILNNGNVGIGTSSPSYLLDIWSTSATLRIRNITAPATGGTSSLLFEGINNYSGVSQSFINSVQAGNSGATQLVFGTSDTTDATATERMRITNTGLFIYGGSSSTNTALFTAKSRTASEIWSFGPNAYNSTNIFRVENSSTTGVYLVSGNTSWTANSDERLKNITGNIENAIDTLKQLRAVKYTWKKDTSNKVNIGLIAQDVIKVLPEIVDIQEDEMNTLGVKYTELVPVLIAAIQELSNELNELKSKIK